MNSNKNKKVSCILSFSWLKIFWSIIFFVVLFFIVIYFQRYLVSREWRKAVKLFENGKYVEAENIYSNLYSKMNWSGRFLAWYADVEMRLGKYEQAIELYEKAKFTYPSPYLFEALGVGYMNYQSGITNEITHPAQSGTPLKRGFELSRRECVNKAVHNWMIAGKILPWRLTSKYYLADFFYQVGELDEAVKYAKLTGTKYSGRMSTEPTFVKVVNIMNTTNRKITRKPI